MKRLSFLLIINLFTIQLYASELVLIATKNLDETKAIFRNPVLTVNFYCSEFAIATLDGHLETPFIGLDDSPWESNFSYYLVLLDTVNRAKYLSMVGHQVKILYASGNYLFLKTDETVFGRLKPAQNDGLVRVFNTRAKLPEPTNLLKDLSIAPDPFVLGLINRVDTSKITATVQHLQNYGHRGWSHPNGLLAQNWIKQVFASYDYKVEVMDFMAYYPNGNDNVIATKIGKKYPDEYVVIGAHYDSFAWEDDKVAPGADDNASGVAGILETARILSQYDFDRTIIFCAFSGEEDGLYGSYAYARNCSEKGMRIVGYFNMDMIGYLKPGNPVCSDVLFTNTALPLFEFYQKVCSVYLPDFIVRKGNMYWGLSDYYSFNNYGYMAIFPFEDYHNYSPYIHTSNDVIGLSYNNAYQASIFTKASIASVVTLANVSSASIPVTWTGWVSSDWNTPVNWQPNIVPKETDNVYIPFYAIDPVINEGADRPAVCNNLTISSGKVLTINPGKGLTVNGNIKGSDGINALMIKSDINGTGSLKVMGSVSASASVQRLLNAQQRHLISSPIGNQTIKDFIAKNADIPVMEATMAYGMREYAATGAAGWNPYFTSEYLIKDSTKIWGFGKGYCIRTAPDPNPKLLNFEGKLNDPASERIRLSTTAANGWNLIGNPLATTIKMSDNTPETSDPDNFMEVNQDNFDSNSYGIYYLNGSAGENGEYEVINKASGNTYAQMGQGFFVKKNNEALVTSMSVTPAMQFHKTSENLKAGNPTYPEVKLTVSGSGKSASTKIRFIDGTHQGLDIGYDAGLFRANPDFCLYSRLVDDNGVDFQLQCLPTDQYNKYRIPIGLDSNTGGEIVISAENVNLESGCCVFLEDIATNSFTDLSKNNYRTTVASNTPGPNRFFLYTANVKGFEAQVTSGKLIAYALGNSEIRLIGKVHDNAEATLYDTSGRTVLKRMLNGSILNILGLSNINSGLYLLTIKDIGTTQTIKVMVRK